MKNLKVLPCLPVADSEMMAENKIPLSQWQRAFSRQSRQCEHQQVCAGSLCSQAPHGDVIDFTAKFFGISVHSAAIKLARDFGIDPRPPTELNIPMPDAEQFQKTEPPCILSVAQDVQRYRRWKREFAPENPNEPYDDRFVEACRNLSHTEYLLDCALEAGCAA